MQRIPCRARQIDLPSTTAERIVRRIDYPSIVCTVVTSYRFKILIGRHTERFTHSIQIIKQRIMALAQIGNLRQPIDHLQIDVTVIVTSPWSFNTRVPYSLQSSRQTTGARRCNHKITSEIEHQVFQSNIHTTILICRKTLSRWQSCKRSVRTIQSQTQPVVQSLIVGNMTGRKSGIVSILYGFKASVSTLSSIFTTKIPLEIHYIIGFHSNKQCTRIGTFQFKTTVFNSQTSSTIAHFHNSHTSHSIAKTTCQRQPVTNCTCPIIAPMCSKKNLAIQPLIFAGSIMHHHYLIWITTERRARHSYSLTYSC